MNNTFRILLVEDEPMSVFAMRTVLRSMGHQLWKAVPTGEEAVQVSISDRPDLIFMDIDLQSEMDGVETVKQIHENVQIPVVYLTSSSDTDIRKRVEETNYLRFLHKPANRFTLNEIIRNQFSLADTKKPYSKVSP